MATQLAEAKLIDRPEIAESYQTPHIGVDSPVTQDKRRMGAVRGIAIGLLIALPFWILIAFVIYLLF